LACKGKFETPDLITGEAEFSPLVGERLRGKTVRIDPCGFVNETEGSVT
jgi:hypothetical protein